MKPDFILSEEWEMPDNLMDLAEAIDFYIENTKVDKRKKEAALFRERINEMVEFYNNGIEDKKYGFKKI